MLTKIGNGPFNQRSESVDLLPLVRNKLSSLSDWLERRRSILPTNRHPATIQVHPALTVVLVSNRVGNAVNPTIDADELRIRNMGSPLTADPEILFDWFRKAVDATQTMGRGLLIVQKIGSQHGLSVTYTRVYSWHELTVCWS